MPGEESLAADTPRQTKSALSRGLIRSDASRPDLKEFPSWGFAARNRCLLGRPRISPLLSVFYKSKASAGTQNEARRSHNDGLPPAGTISRPTTTGRRLQKTPAAYETTFITREKPPQTRDGSLPPANADKNNEQQPGNNEDSGAHSPSSFAAPTPQKANVCEQPPLVEKDPATHQHHAGKEQRKPIDVEPERASDIVLFVKQANRASKKNDCGSETYENVPHAPKARHRSADVAFPHLGKRHGKRARSILRPSEMHAQTPIGNPRKRIAHLGRALIAVIGI